MPLAILKVTSISRLHHTRNKPPHQHLFGWLAWSHLTNLSPVFIMKTTWNSSPIIGSWFSSIVDITHSICFHLFSWTHKGIQQPHPISQSACFPKTDIPLPAPDYNPSAQALPFQQAKEYQAMLFTLHTNYSEGTVPITSDDLLVVLDSGCTCTISFDWHCREEDTSTRMVVVSPYTTVGY